jgi:hypothetical protein
MELAPRKTLEARAVEALTGRGVVSHQTLYEDLGIPRVSISRLVEKGVLLNTARGFYVLADEWDGDPLPLLAARYGGDSEAPRGVICLQMAAYLHGLTDLGLHNIPRPEVALSAAVSRGDADRVRARVIRLREPHAVKDVEWRMAGGRGIHVTSPSRTACDLYSPWAGPLPEGMAAEVLARLLDRDRRAAEHAVQRASDLGWGREIRVSLKGMVAARRWTEMSEEVLPEEGGLRL